MRIHVVKECFSLAIGSSVVLAWGDSQLTVINSETFLMLKPGKYLDPEGVGFGVSLAQ